MTDNTTIVLFSNPQGEVIRGEFLISEFDCFISFMAEMLFTMEFAKFACIVFHPVFGAYHVRGL